jgi:hypothetical protein
MERAKKRRDWLFTGMKGVPRLMFNDFTLYSFHIVRKLFFDTDLGNGYFATAKKAWT